jgi:putative ABC transport system ATP-binding protein
MRPDLDLTLTPAPTDGSPPAVPGSYSAIATRRANAQNLGSSPADRRSVESRNNPSILVGSFDPSVALVDVFQTGTAGNAAVERTPSTVDTVGIAPPVRGGLGNETEMTRVSQTGLTPPPSALPALLPAVLPPARRPGSLPVAVGSGRGFSLAGPVRPTILARDIHKGYANGRVRAPIVRGVSLAVNRGETVFLVGPSGSGKTTLLSVLGCILTPDQGSVEVLGQDVARMRPDELTAFRRRHLGFIFQTFNLFPTLSAVDNVRLALELRGVGRRAARSRAAELLGQVGLSNRLRVRPPRLSTGECQRVAIARALAGDPSVLLADEPTAALDAENGQAVMGMLARLAADRGLTVLIVTHDNRIAHFADRILRLEDGRLAGPSAAERHHLPYGGKLKEIEA